MLKQFEEMKVTGQLPSPSGVGMAVLRLTQKEDFCTEDLTHALHADPALSGRIIKMANCAATAGVEPASTVGEAVMRLGVSTVRNVALGFSLVSSNRSGICGAFDYDAFWSESLARAVAGQAVARVCRLGDPAETYSCGLFSGIGTLALASVHPDSYVEILNQAKGHSARKLAELERGRYEIDHWEVARYLLADWGLPKSFGEAIALSSDPEADMETQHARTQKLTAAMRFAKAMATTCVAGEQAHSGHWKRLEQTREQLGISAEAFVRLCDAVPEEWHEWGEMLSIDTMQVPQIAEIQERPVPEQRAPDAPDCTEPSVIAGAQATDEACQPQDESMTILVVDNDKDSLRLIALHLRKAGHEVMLAQSGEEALETILKQSPQIVISGWTMPEMDGVELCRAMRRYEAGSQMYFVLLSEQEDEDKIVEAFEQGIDDMISKPFNPKLLLARVLAGKRVVALQNQVRTTSEKVRKQVAELGVLNRKLRQSAVTDALTGLPNRLYAMETMHQAWEEATRDQTPMSVVMMDIDFFKKVNDVHGHDAGDEVLKQTAAVFQKNLRTDECVCRIGGEEFLIILPKGGADEATSCAERVRAAVEANHISWGDFDRNVTVSLGVAESSPDMADAEDLLKAADLAVYESKEGGRNRVSVASGVPVPG
jgi:diguanylate cyclase (GGDEF)-like protein